MDEHGRAWTGNFKLQIWLIGLAAAVFAGGGCTLVCENRVFPKLAWYWSADAKMEREYNREEAEAVRNYQRTNSATTDGHR